MSDAERTINLTVRVNINERTELRQRSFSAGMSMSSYLRLSGLSGAPVGPKPPSVADLPDPCKKLLAVCFAGLSNLTQLGQHAASAGAPLDKLCGPGGFLMQAQAQLRELGLQVKAGTVDSSKASSILEAQLLESSDSLNVLAEALNESQEVSPNTWHSVLTALHSALERVK